jgi:hypothetical protein
MPPSESIGWSGLVLESQGWLRGLGVEVDVGVEGGVVGGGFVFGGDGVVVGEQGAVLAAPDAEPPDLATADLVEQGGGEQEVVDLGVSLLGALLRLPPRRRADGNAG